MNESILQFLYSNELYLSYLRNHPSWYPHLFHNPSLLVEFQKEVKTTLKMTTVDKIEKLRKQVDFINGILRYLSNE